jgi:hypothetical protein
MYLNITVKPFVQLIHANKINLKITVWAGDVTEVVEHMLSKLKALSSNHSTTKKIYKLSKVLEMIKYLMLYYIRINTKNTKLCLKHSI